MEDSMSALEWSTTDLGLAVPSAPRRPHLVVLPGGAGAPAASGPVRITRRGRLALLALVLAIVAAFGVMGMRGAGAAEPTRTVTVSAGQTLSEIAAAQLPDMSISEGILAIQLANSMSTAQISAGQQLVIPRS
jgi:Tfp pilus assembly protein FimV